MPQAAASHAMSAQGSLAYMSDTAEAANMAERQRQAAEQARRQTEQASRQLAREQEALRARQSAMDAGSGSQPSWESMPSGKTGKGKGDRKQQRSREFFKRWKDQRATAQKAKGGKGKR